MTEAEHKTPRSAHPIADLLGGILRGGRPGDDVLQRRAKKITVTGLACFVAWEAWSFAKDGVTEERKAHAKNIAAIVSELKDVALELKDNTTAVKDLTVKVGETNAFNAGLVVSQIDRPAAKPYRPKPEGRHP